MRDSVSTPEKKTPLAALSSWALYDLANTIFALSILSYFFPLWLGDELGVGAGAFNYITAASMLLVAVTAPFFGAMADLRQRRKPYLVLFTVLAVTATLALDLSGTIVIAAALFIAANFTYQSALIFYNSLLPGVAGGRGSGRVSGYGVAAGYGGTIIALVFIPVFITNPVGMRSLLGPLGGWIETSGALNSNAFVPTAILYLIFSLPAFFFVPDRKVRAPQPVSLGITYRDVLRTIRNMSNYPGIGVFILSTILYTDAANTVIANMALYGREVFGMTQGEISKLLLFSTLFAIVGAVFFGFLTDRIGPKYTLVLVLITWLAAILFVAVAVEAWMMMLAGPLVGAALGSTGAVSRVMLIALSPAEKLGEFFGLYSLAGKLSAVTGPMLTAVLLTVFSDLGSTGYRLAVASLILIMAAGLFLLLRVPNIRPERVVEEFS